MRNSSWEILGGPRSRHTNPHESNGWIGVLNGIWISYCLLYLSYSIICLIYLTSVFLRLPWTPIVLCFRWRWILLRVIMLLKTHWLYSFSRAVIILNCLNLVRFFLGPRLCRSVGSLESYISATCEFRLSKASILFLSVTRPHRPIHSSTLGHWLKSCLSGTGLLSPDSFSAHSTWSAADS